MGADEAGSNLAQIVATDALAWSGHRASRKPLPSSVLSRVAQLDQRTALPDQCLHSAEADVRPPGGESGFDPKRPNAPSGGLFNSPQRGSNVVVSNSHRRGP
jgi:hypothetical protein